MSSRQPLALSPGFGWEARSAERALQARFDVYWFDLDPGRYTLLARLGGKLQVLRHVAAGAQDRLFANDHRSSGGRLQEWSRASIRQYDYRYNHWRSRAVTKVAQRLRRRGINYLDTAIAGNSAEARSGNVLVLAGGDARALKSCEDVFASFARRVYHAGPCGHGARMKLVFNLALGLHPRGGWLKR